MALAGCLWCAPASPGAAQSTTGIIAGVVKGSTGAVVVKFQSTPSGDGS